jgi:hypothetical protein
MREVRLSASKGVANLANSHPKLDCTTMSSDQDLTTLLTRDQRSDLMILLGKSQDSL